MAPLKTTPSVQDRRPHRFRSLLQIEEERYPSTGNKLLSRPLCLSFSALFRLAQPKRDHTRPISMPRWGGRRAKLYGRLVKAGPRNREEIGIPVRRDAASSHSAVRILARLSVHQWLLQVRTRRYLAPPRLDQLIGRMNITALRRVGGDQAAAISRAIRSCRITLHILSISYPARSAWSGYPFPAKLFIRRM